MCECCGQQDHDALYLPEAEKPFNTTHMNERNRSLDLKTGSRGSGRTVPESLPRRDVIKADD